MREKIFKVSALMSVALLLCGMVSSCVHEWPDELTPADVDVNLEFNTEFLPFKDVEYTKKTKSDPSEYNIRYKIGAYRALKSGGYDVVPLREYTFTKLEVSEPDYRVRIALPEGEYMLRAWTDYVLDGTQDDLYYLTDDFSAVQVREPYEGDTDFKDAFVGESPVNSVRVGTEAPKVSATIEMERPLAKFQFVAEDLYDLVTKTMEKNMSASEYADYKNSRRPLDGEGTGAARPSSADYDFSVGLTDALDGGTKAPWDPTKAPGFDPDSYKVVFYYTSFLPTMYNVLTQKPIDAKTGMTFTSTLSPLNEEEALIGFDYVLVNGTESSVSVQVGLYDPEGTMLSLSNPVTVPIVRGKVTTVRGKFLTLATGSGIGVSPGFDGEYNIELK